MLGRRELLKKAGAVLFTISISLSSMAVSCGNVISDILNWTPVGLAAFNQIVTLLESEGVINVLGGGAVISLIAIIQKAFNDLKAAVLAYQAITPPPVGALAKIDAALGLIIADLQTFMGDLNIPDPSLVTVVVGMASIIMSTIAGFVLQLPASTQAQLPTIKDRLARNTKVGNTLVSYVPLKRSNRYFIKEWNTLCSDGGHKEAQLPLSLFQHL
jgi:hypothetical protein